MDPPADDGLSAKERQDYLDAIPNGELRQFCEETFPASFLRANPQIYASTDWIVISKHKEWKKQRAKAAPLAIASTPVKAEPKELALTPDTAAQQHCTVVSSRLSLHDGCPITVKIEPGLSTVPNPLQAHSSLRFHTVHENGHEILSLISDSSDPVTSDDDRADVDSTDAYSSDESADDDSQAWVGVIELSDDESVAGVNHGNDSRRFSHSSSPSVYYDAEDESMDGSGFYTDSRLLLPDCAGLEMESELGFGFSDEDFVDENDPELQPDTDIQCLGKGAVGSLDSSTTWFDDDISSTVLTYAETRVKVTREFHASRIEHVHGLPSYWPILREDTAFVLDLSDPKYNEYDGKGNLRPVDVMIRNKDNDSWGGSSGKADSKPLIYCMGPTPIQCRRVRGTCNGIHACERLDNRLQEIKRFELEKETFNEVVKAQAEARRLDGTTDDKQAIMFFMLYKHKPCQAVDDDGCPCTGMATLKARKEVYQGKHYFISCSKRTNTWNKGHLSLVIPANVDEGKLKQLESGIPLGNMAEVSCSRIVSSRTGDKVKWCPYPHNSNGERSRMVHLKCPATRSIFVPLDPTLRWAVVVPNHEVPHNHPMLPTTKVSFEAQRLYRDCVKANGSIGSTVQNVDNVTSTRVILQGKSLAEVHPSLQHKHVKARILKSVQKDEYPFGRGLEGVVDLLSKDKVLTAKDQYVHHISTGPTGGLMIYTCKAGLLKHVHDAHGLHADTTFKRTDGDLKELEFSIWNPLVNEAETIARLYTNRADRQHFRDIFDNFQSLVVRLTRKPLLFRALSPGGTLICLNVDMELAQVLGAADSFISTNVPEHSSLKDPTANEIIASMVRICVTHVKRGIHALRSHVNAEDYKCLMGFPHLQDEASLRVFDNFIKSLKCPEVTAWWHHKTSNPWIFLGLFAFRSLIPREHFLIAESTTNVGEGQHHWTERQTGHGLPLLTSIVKARAVDNATEARINAILSSGVLANNYNSAADCLRKNVNWKAAAARRSNAQAEKNESIRVLEETLQAQTMEQKENRAKAKQKQDEIKDTKDQLSALKARPVGRCGPVAESSSSGKAPKGKGRKKKASTSPSETVTVAVPAVATTVSIDEGAVTPSQPLHEVVNGTRGAVAAVQLEPSGRDEAKRLHIPHGSHSGDLVAERNSTSLEVAGNLTGDRVSIVTSDIEPIPSYIDEPMNSPSSPSVSPNLEPTIPVPPELGEVPDSSEAPSFTSLPSTPSGLQANLKRSWPGKEDSVSTEAEPTKTGIPPNAKPLSKRRKFSEPAIGTRTSLRVIQQQSSLISTAVAAKGLHHWKGWMEVDENGNILDGDGNIVGKKGQALYD